MYRAYSCTVRGSGWLPTAVHGTTIGKAKYKFWLEIRDAYPDITYIQITACKPVLISEDRIKNEFSSNQTPLVREANA